VAIIEWAVKLLPDSSLRKRFSPRGAKLLLKAFYWGREASIHFGRKKKLKRERDTTSQGVGGHGRWPDPLHVGRKEPVLEGEERALADRVRNKGTQVGNKLYTRHASAGKILLTGNLIPERPEIEKIRKEEALS